MRILLISHWYKPIKSPVKRMVRIAERLSQKHQVTVLTSLPSYPTGILPPRYRGKFWIVEEENLSPSDDLTILRVWDFPTPNQGLIKRSLNYLAFVITASLATLFLEPFDLVIVSSPNFFSGIAGVIAARIGKSKFIFDVRDLWPDSAIELGYLQNQYLIGIFKKMEKYFYKKADKVFTATEEIRRTIIEMGILEKKVVTLLNTVDIKVFRPKKVNPKKYGYSRSDFLIIYIGSLTIVQNLQTVIEAGQILKKFPRIKFLIVGEGEDKENLIAQAKKLGLKNIAFMPGQPTEKIVELMNLADIGLISLAKKRFFSDYALPTKTSEYLGCGKPIVACAGKTLKQLIEKNQVGKVVPPGDSPKLSKAILDLYRNRKDLQKYSQNARRLAQEKFSDENFYAVLEDNLS